MPTQEELVLKQFAQAKTKLGQQKKGAQDVLQQGLDRQRALTGMSGGRAIKAESKARKTLEEGFSGAEADITGQEAAALQNVAAQKEQQAFQTQEREASQQFAGGEAEKQRTFASGESEKDRAEQIRQFNSQYSLQRDTFNESKNQFSQQMKFQWDEFRENQKTNMINAVNALKKSGIMDANAFNQYRELAYYAIDY